jgi:hypothetical protein
MECFAFIFACSPVALETMSRQSCWLGTAVVLSSVYTAVTLLTSHNIKVNFTTIWDTKVLVLLMPEICEGHRSGGLRWHGIRTYIGRDWCRHVSNITVTESLHKRIADRYETLAKRKT